MCLVTLLMNLSTLNFCVGTILSITLNSIAKIVIWILDAVKSEIKEELSYRGICISNNNIVTRLLSTFSYTLDIIKKISNAMQKLSS